MKKPRVVAIIPARMASTRFPGKPMALIAGIPMIGHCYFRTTLAKTIDETWVATCDQEIFDYIKSVGGKAVMTAHTHERCTERTAEALTKIEAATGQMIDIVAMVQGDEPMVLPDMIDDAVRILHENPEAGIASLMTDIKTDAELEDANVVKVVIDPEANALYFSREPIPSRRKTVGGFMRFKQVAIIPARRDYLKRYVSLAPTPLEVVESVDLLRCLENGDRVKMGFTRFQTSAVDTPEDLKRVESLMARDALIARYAKVAAK